MASNAQVTAQEADATKAPAHTDSSAPLLMSSTPSSSSRTPLFIAAALLRLVLSVAFPHLQDLLTNRAEISTPVSSFKRLQEGLFLYSHNVSPYDGGVYHQPPLLLPLFSLLPDARRLPLFTTLLYIVIDLASAHALASIADSGEAGASRLFASPRRAKRWSGLAVAATFLFNPFTIATCLARSTSVFTNAAILHAVSRAISGSSLGAMAALSFAAYLSMSPVLLLPPLVLLAYDRRRRASAAASAAASSSLPLFAAKHVLAFGLSVAALLAMSFLTVDQSWAFLWPTYGVHLTLQDLTPNVGLWWYFFVEMFDSFRAFFLAVFWLHLGSYVGGLSVRIRTQPLAVITILLGILGIFKPYPSLADTSLFLAVVALFRHLFPLMRYSFVTAATILYATCLGPAFYHLWIYAGSGNANFFYAITLVWSLGQSLLVSDLTFAVLRDEWEVERPEMVGKDIRQI